MSNNNKSTKPLYELVNVINDRLGFIVDGFGSMIIESYYSHPNQVTTHYEVSMKTGEKSSLVLIGGIPYKEALCFLKGFNCALGAHQIDTIVQAQCCLIDDLQKEVARLQKIEQQYNENEHRECLIEELRDE